MSDPLLIEVPGDLRHLLLEGNGSGRSLPSWALEAVVLEAYRRRRISRGKVGELLRLGFHECESFLAERGVPENYDESDLEEDSLTFDRLLAT